MQKVKLKPDAENRSLVLLDTHAALWLGEGNRKIEKCRRLLESAYEESRLAISAISAWEIGVLVSKGKLTLNRAPVEWCQKLLVEFNIRALDVDIAIALNSSFLPGEFHGDPADRLIVATTLHYDATLVTADRAILAYGRRNGLNTFDL